MPNSCKLIEGNDRDSPHDDGVERHRRPALRHPGAAYPLLWPGAVRCGANSGCNHGRLTIDFRDYRQTLGGYYRCGALGELLGASSTKFLESNAPAHRVGTACELGVQQGAYHG
ncbi:hypothetical protein TcBrA4_0129330 [Trypanosoma cruzi]|nr:hypothetical protein TcBrA4_0129330 [Trypanosoma cruzi]